MNKQDAMNKLEDCIDFINLLHWECGKLTETVKGIDDNLNKIGTTISLVEYHINMHMKDKENETI